MGELGSLLWETEDSPLVNMPSLGLPGAAMLNVGVGVDKCREGVSLG